MSACLNAIGVAIALVMVFFREIGHFSVAIAAVTPVLLSLIIKRYKGVIRIMERKNSVYPSIIWGFLAPIVALLLRSLLAYDIQEYGEIWKYAIPAALFFFCLVTIGTPEFRSRKADDLIGMGMIAAISIAYGFSVIVALNCEYDPSTPDHFDANVLEKRVSGSKSKSYYVTLSPWGPKSSNEEVTISSSLYQRLNVKDHVHVYLYKGKLQAPWIIVTD